MNNRAPPTDDVERRVTPRGRSSSHYRDAVSGTTGGFVVGLVLAFAVGLTSIPPCSGTPGCLDSRPGNGAVFSTLTLVIVFPSFGSAVGCLAVLKRRKRPSSATTALGLGAASLFTWPILFVGGFNLLNAIQDDKWAVALAFPFVGALALLTGAAALLRWIAVARR